MRRISRRLLSLAVILIALQLWAFEEKHQGRHDVHSEVESSTVSTHTPTGAADASKVGPELAVVAVSAEGFKLSETAAAGIGLRLQPVTRTGAQEIPIEAIVHSKEASGLYRSRSGWLRFVPGRFVPQGDTFRFVPRQEGDLQLRDALVTGGAAVVRATDLYLSSESESEGE